MTNTNFNGLRHGEVMLIPVKEIPNGKTLKKGDYLLAHSETGHHHVLEGTGFEVTELGDGQVFLKVLRATDLTHRKTYDKHRTLTIPESLLERYHMVEYDPAGEAIRVVRD